MKNNYRLMKTMIKLFAVMATCLTLASCYWDDMAYAYSEPYVIVGYPTRTIVVRERPVVVERRMPPPPPRRSARPIEPRRGGRR